VLEGAGALEGTIVRAGVPAAAEIIATPSDGAAVRFRVWGGTDGAYRFDRLAPGAYRIVARLRGESNSRQAAGGAQHSGDVNIETAQTVRLDLEFPAGINLTVNVELSPGDDEAQVAVILLAGSFGPDTDAELEELVTAASRDSVRHGILPLAASKSGSLQFPDVAPGKHTVCVEPVTFQIVSPDTIKLQATDSQPVACRVVDLRAGGRTKQLELVVPTLVEQ